VWQEALASLGNGRRTTLDVGSDGRERFLVEAPVQEGDDAAPVGFVLGWATMEEFSALFAQTKPLGEQGETFLADHAGKALTTIRYVTADRQTHAISAGPMLDCLQGHARLFTIEPDYAGVPTAMSYRPVQEIGGCVMVHMRAEEVYAPVHRLREQLLSIVGLTFAIVALATLVATKRVADLTAARARAETAQANLATERLLLLESLQEGVYGIDLNNRCAFINPAALRLLGWQQDQVIGKDVHALAFHTNADGSTYPGKACAVVQVMQTGQDLYREQGLCWRQNGASFPVEYSAHPLVTAGRITGAVVTFTDLTERLRLEEHGRHVQRLETAGRLAGGTAHHFNNLMTVVIACSEMLLGQLAPDDPSRTEAAAIRDAGGKAAALARHLLAVGRKQMLQPTPVDLNTVVAEMESRLRPLLGVHVELSLMHSPAPVPVTIDRRQTQDVLAALARNAREAMPQGGRMLIKTEVAELETAVTHRHDAIPPGLYGRLTVSDTGKGMGEDMLARLFQPFFTTKNVGDGDGLNLAAAYGFVKQSSGYMLADSEAGRGSRFTIYLPLTPD
jgi:PAS domain S-box-containing protein